MHAIVILAADNTTVTIIEPSGRVARLDELVDATGQIQNAGIAIPLRRIRYGDTLDLPDPSYDVINIVSRVTAAALPDRHDLVFPDREVRDTNGRLIGCRGLARFAQQSGRQQVDFRIP